MAADEPTTAAEAADWIEAYEARSREQRPGFGSLLDSGPWGRALRLLIDHARATASERSVPSHDHDGYVPTLEDLTDALYGALTSSDGWQETAPPPPVREWWERKVRIILAVLSVTHGLPAAAGVDSVL